MNAISWSADIPRPSNLNTLACINRLNAVQKASYFVCAAALLLQLQIWKRRRRKHWFYDLSFVFLLFLHAAKAAKTSDLPNRHQRSITTPFGVVRGETIIPASEDDLPAVTQYLGIPYGVAPSGQYRFNMAISAPKWTHQPKNAFKLSPVCIQSGLPQLSEAEALKVMSSHRFDELHRIYPFLKPESEDCLYLNLYIPERPESNQDGSGAGGNSQPLSVLVIVHGSDYDWGAGNAYNASILAAYSQTAVVTLNYRLGIYGFLGRCESNSCTGNAGLSDLVAALKMLSNILPSFGADPSSLTLLGWGSGASLISLLMASPITQPKNRLFRRAILLDGSALCPWAMVENPQEYLLKIAMELHCIREEKKSGDKSANRHNRLNDVFQKQVSHVMRCIQEHSHQNLTAAARKISAPTFLSAFGPIIDGQIVPNHPKYSFSPKYGALFRDIDLMIGTVMSPAHHLLPNADLESGFDLQKRDKIFRTLVRNLFNFHRTEIFNAIVNEYTDWDNPKNHPKTLRGNVVAALSDSLFTAPLIRMARMHSTDEIAKTSNTFMFVFTHEVERFWTSQNSRAQSASRGGGIRGSLSDDHLPYILGYPLSVRQRDAHDYGRFTSDDKGISRVLMQYISNFVKSGDPSKPQSILTRTAVEERFFGTPWPQYSPTTREAYIEISDRPRVKNYYRNSYVGFWNSFIPQLNRDNRENNVPEDHNFLPDHFKRDSFFGITRHYSSFHNDPFPPPPLPPTPFPIEALKKTTSTASQPTLPTFKPGSAQENVIDHTVRKSDSYFFAGTVAVGVGFLVLNLCLYYLMYRKCSEGRRNSKKRLKYQSYTVGHPSTSEINFAQNSSLAQFQPINSASVLNETTLKTDGIKMVSSDRRPTSHTGSMSSGVPVVRNGDVVSGSARHTSISTNGSKLINVNEPSSLMAHEHAAGSVSRAMSTSADVGNFSVMNRSYTSNKRVSASAMSSSMHSGNAKNTGQSRQSYLTANYDSSIDDGANEMEAIMKSMSSVISASNGGVTTVRRLSLKEQEPLLSKNSTLTKVGGTVNLMRPGISPTCPRHGRAAQMMLAAAAAAAVSRANSTGAQNAPLTATSGGFKGSGYNENTFGNGPVQMITASSPTEAMLEEAQV